MTACITLKHPFWGFDYNLGQSKGLLSLVYRTCSYPMGLAVLDLAYAGYQHRDKLKFEQGESPALSTVLVPSMSMSLCARIVPKRALSSIPYLLQARLLSWIVAVVN